MRIASFNVENLFSRPKAFHATSWTENEPILAAFKKVNELIAKVSYSDSDRKKIRDQLLKLDIYSKNDQGAIRRKYSTNPKWAWLRKNRGKFDKQTSVASEDVEVTAGGRADWIGWIELATEPVDDIGVRLTAQVISDVNADVIGIIEAEDRPSLVRFNEELLNELYRHVMLVDGNDDRGIDVGIMTKAGFEIGKIRSNVDAEDEVGTIFSRDCPQYEVVTPGGDTLHILVNHFKSQSGGGGDKRKRQAQEVRRIVDELTANGEHVVVMGDLNEGLKSDGSTAENLADLFDPAGPLLDCYALPGFDVGNRPGTYDSCGNRNRLDYILISESLEEVFEGGGVFRNGLWGNRKTRPDKWDTYPEMTSSAEQASDHAAVFIDLDL